MLKDIITGGILAIIAMGLYAEARYQIKDNTSEIAAVKVHQQYNTQYFIEIKKSIEEVKTEIKNLKGY